MSKEIESDEEETSKGPKKAGRVESFVVRDHALPDDTSQSALKRQVLKDVPSDYSDTKIIQLPHP